jgi:hypothetical protein
MILFVINERKTFGKQVLLFVFNALKTSMDFRESKKGIEIDKKGNEDGFHFKNGDE